MFSSIRLAGIALAVGLLCAAAAKPPTLIAQDLAFANEALANHVCLNDGSGGFSCSNVSSGALLTRGLAVGDMDGANGLDPIYANGFFAQNQVCFNDGLGNFSCSNASSDAFNTQDAAVGDFDGGLGLDIVFANVFGANRVCMNDGAGSFSCSNVSSDAFASNGVAVGDVNAGSGLDLVFANEGSTNRVCLNNGSGSFTCSDVSADAFLSTGVAIEDVDGGSGPDLIFTNTDAAGAANRVCVNNGSGSFTCSNVSSDTFSTYDVAIGELDGNAGLDLVFANLGAANRLCVNNGSGSFTCSNVSGDANQTYGVAIGELDGNAGLDLALANIQVANRTCFNDGSGSFSCSNVDATVYNSRDVEITSTSLVSLPVELTSFEAVVEGQRVLLSWATASESMNAGFDVEQEIGSDVFEAIGYVDGHGTTTEPQEYTYTVTDLSPGRYVFRLKQTDFDGTFEYSETVEASVTVPDQFVLESAYPNPFNPATTIRFAVAAEEAVALTLVDSQGRAVKTLYSGTPTANEMQSVRIDAEGLASGSYIVRLTGEGFVASEQVTLLR